VGDIPRELLLLVAIAIMFCSFGLLEALIRRPLVAAGIVLAVTVLDEALGEALVLNAGALGITPMDVGTALIATAGLARLLRQRTFTTGQRLLIAIVLLLLLSLARGIADHGQPAVVEVRSFIRVYGVALYFSTVVLSDHLLDRIGWAWVVAGMVLVAILSLRWVGALAGIPLGLLDATHASARYALKAVSGPASFIIGQSMMLVLAAAALHPKAQRYRWLAFVFTVCVVLLNRRAVWLAALAGVPVLLMQSARLRQRLLVPLMIASVLGVGALVYLSSQTGLVTEDEEAIAADATSTGTFEARVEGWSDLLGSSGPEGLQWLVGESMGTGYEREVSDRERKTNPHNYYVQSIVRIGVVGIACLFGIYLWAMSRLRHAPAATTLLSSRLLFVLIVMQAIFISAWQAGIEQGMILGLAIAAAGAVTRARTPATVHEPIPVGAT
jgi:hypothetical protein